jgi:hypothetical protein
MSTNIDGLADLITEYMSNYTLAVTDELKKDVDIVAKEVNEEIKRNVTFEGSGKYVKAFKIKTAFEDRFNKRNTWHVAAPHYRLTHLLENGHALRNGGRSRAFQHIKYGEDLAIRRMEELAKEAVENANGR